MWNEIKRITSRSSIEQTFFCLQNNKIVQTCTVRMQKNCDLMRMVGVHH